MSYSRDSRLRQRKQHVIVLTRLTQGPVFTKNTGQDDHNILEMCLHALTRLINIFERGRTTIHLVFSAISNNLGLLYFLCCGGCDTDSDGRSLDGSFHLAVVL